MPGGGAEEQLLQLQQWDAMAPLHEALLLLSLLRTAAVWVWTSLQAVQPVSVAAAPCKMTGACAPRLEGEVKAIHRTVALTVSLRRP
jgi:hypothetical protein